MNEDKDEFEAPETFEIWDGQHRWTITHERLNMFKSSPRSRELWRDDRDIWQEQEDFAKNLLKVFGPHLSIRKLRCLMDAIAEAFEDHWTSRNEWANKRKNKVDDDFAIELTDATPFEEVAEDSQTVFCLAEDSHVKELKRVPLILANTVNRNGVLYTEEALKKAAEKANRNGFIPGTNGYKCDGKFSTPLAEMSFVTDNYIFEDGKLRCDVHIMNTPKGKKLLEMLEQDDVVFLPAGVGTADPDDAGVVQVGGDYEPLSIGAFPKNQSAQPEELYERT